MLRRSSGITHAAHLELHIKRVCLELMDYPCKPPLFFRNVVGLHPSIRGLSLNAIGLRRCLFLILNKYLRQLEDASDIFGRLQSRFVFNDAGDDGMGDGSTGRI